ncbi:unnamed protein product [Miscanthus lutarioriparius]|uniref:Increased DNA methylation 1 C-terminal domain-containing protein n=1 Tax=Miscanthus lutarioriparius TaxID=422564 RepID=A0A811M8H1_9POAL|nr:unnamed protein product [Miscanthus lutarioriparius]
MAEGSKVGCSCLSSAAAQPHRSTRVIVLLSRTRILNITCVKDLLPFLFHIESHVLDKQNARLEGFVTDGGYACASPVSACCGYRGKVNQLDHMPISFDFEHFAGSVVLFGTSQGFLLRVAQVLSARQFEKHAGAESKNQNGHILLPNGKSLYDLFHKLRDVPAKAFAEEFRAAAGVPMTVPAAEASSAPQGQQAGAPASWEPNGVQVDGVTAEPPSAPAPGRGDVVMLTEEEKASLCLLGSNRESSSTTESDTMCGVEGPAAEQIKDETGGDPVMHDVKVRVTETKYQLDSDLRDVRGLLSTGLLEGFRVTYRKDEVENVGLINGQGYSCGCPQCNYSSNGGESTKTFQLHLNDHNAPHANFTLKESASNAISNHNWSASKRRSGGQFRQGGTETSTPTFSGSPGKGVSGLSTGTSEKKGIEETRNISVCLHDFGWEIPNRILLLLMISDRIRKIVSADHDNQQSGKAAGDNAMWSSVSTKDASRSYKLIGVVEEFTPSHFEEHAGMGRRQQPYHNIYTSEGLSLHNLALQLQDRLNSNGFDNASVSSFSDYPNLTSSGCGRQPSTTSGPIVPLKRTLQERVVETESCYFCGYGHTMIGNIDPDTIIFCNQYERPCHVKCYNNRVVKKKNTGVFASCAAKNVNRFRARLLEGLENCEEITFLRRIRSKICWRLLSGMDASRDVKLYMPQAIDIFKAAFVESTDEHIDIFSDMVNGKNGDQEKDFQGMYCALLTASKHVVSAAILKVLMEQIAELVLIAIRGECRKNVELNLNQTLHS